MRKILLDIFYLSFSRGLAIILMLVSYLFLFRYLKPEILGQYQVIVALCMIAGVVIDLGLTNYIIKMMTEESDKVDIWFGKFLKVIYRYLLVLYIFFAVISLYIFPSELYWYALINFFGVCVTGLQYPYLTLLTTKGQLKKVSIANLCGSIGSASVILACVYFKSGLEVLVLTPLMSGLFMVSSYVVMSKRLPVVMISGDRLVYRDFFKVSWPFIVLTMVAALYNRIDTILISKLLGYSEAGVYSSAYKYLELANSFPALIAHTLFPVLTGASLNGVSHLRLVFEKYQRLLVGLAVFISTVAFFYSKEILWLLAGDQYSTAYASLAILVFANGVLFCYLLINNIMINKYTKQAILVSVFSLVVNIIGNIVLLPKFGIVAAALLTVICEMVQLVGYSYFVKSRSFKFKWSGFLLKPLLGIVLAVLVMYLVDLFLLLEGLFVYKTFSSIIRIGITTFAGFCVYLLFLTQLKYINLKEYVAKD